METRWPVLCPHLPPEQSSVPFSEAWVWNVMENLVTYMCTRFHSGVSPRHSFPPSWMWVWDSAWVGPDQEEPTPFLKCHSAFPASWGQSHGCPLLNQQRQPLCLSVLLCLPNFCPVEMGSFSPKCEFHSSRWVRALSSVSELLGNSGTSHLGVLSNLLLTRKCWSLKYLLFQTHENRFQVLSRVTVIPVCFLGWNWNRGVTSPAWVTGALGRVSPRNVSLHGCWPGAGFLSDLKTRSYLVFST